MIKVYCNDCKYFYCDECVPAFIISRCFAPKNCILIEQKVQHTYREKTIIEPYISSKSTPKELNKNNNCKYYERKWWKFWVK